MVRNTAEAWAMRYPREIPKCNCHSYNDIGEGTDPEAGLDPRPYFDDVTKKVVDIDACIAPIIQELWEQGVQTAGSCCGHNKTTRYLHLLYEKDIPRALSTIANLDRGGEWHIFFVDDTSYIYYKVPLAPITSGPFPKTMLPWNVHDDPRDSVEHYWDLKTDIGVFNIAKIQEAGKWMWELSFHADDNTKVVPPLPQSDGMPDSDVVTCERDLPLLELRDIAYRHYTYMWRFLAGRVDRHFTEEDYSYLAFQAGTTYHNHRPIFQDK